MNINSRHDRRIIRFVLPEICFIFFISILFSCMGVNMNMTHTGSISIANEQEYWNAWIAKNEDDTCPLEPFLLNSNENELRLLDKKIENSIQNSDAYLLVIKVNISNGILEIVCILREDEPKKIKVLSWDCLREEVLEKSYKGHRSLDDHLLKKLSSHTGFVDVSDRMLLDGDSVYITLFYKGRNSRYAIYNPEFDGDQKKGSDVQMIAIETLLNITKNLK